MSSVISRWPLSRPEIEGNSLSLFERMFELKLFISYV
jgi:hypothetical protein